MNNIPNWVLLIVQVASTAIVGGYGYFLKRELAKTEKIMNEVHEFKIKVSEDYVRKEDYNLNNGEVLKRLDKIQDMLFEMNKGGNN